MGYSYCAPISIAAVEQFGDDFGRNPVGTGPYKFVEWTADDTIVLEKNPEHTWSTPYYTTQQAPAIDRVEFVVIPEDATRLAALEAGEVDVVAGTDAVPIDKIRIAHGRAGDLTVVTRPAVGVYYAYFNQSDRAVERRARAAGDPACGRSRGDCRACARRQRDTGHERVGIGVRRVQGRSAAVPLRSRPGRELLTEAGYADGFDLTYLNIASPVYQRVAEVLQEYLAEVNINLSRSNPTRSAS